MLLHDLELNVKIDYVLSGSSKAKIRKLGSGDISAYGIELQKDEIFPILTLVEAEDKKTATITFEVRDRVLTMSVFPSPIVRGT